MVTDAIYVPGSRATIQPATWRDFSAIRRLEQVCFPKDAWPMLDILGVLTLPSVLRLKASLNELLVGFVACDIRRMEQTAWIATIGVLPEHRRQGIGTALLTACEQQVSMPAIRLNVRTSNQAAIHVYQNLGYSQVALWPRYYQDGEDALVLEKRLD